MTGIQASWMSGGSYGARLTRIKRSLAQANSSCAYAISLLERGMFRLGKAPVKVTDLHSRSTG